MILWIVLLTLSVNVKSAAIDGSAQAQLYLSQFGYISRQNMARGNLMDISTWEQAIADFQNFAGLEPSGELNSETLELMQTPRCGVQDKIGSDSRSRRYALQGSRWKVKTVTYRISKYSRKLSRQDTDAEIAKAFDIWSKHSGLKFKVKLDDPVHIDIRFEEGEHGDGDPFDGLGGTLAHAYFPTYGGDAHFDEAEKWTINTKAGTNLFQVAAHEIGHSLGLSHSDVRTALMAPFYRGYIPNFRLDPDDIQAIQALYDKHESATTPAPTEASKPFFPRDNSLCESPQMDTIFTTAEGDIFMFKNDKYYKITRNRIDGEPGRIDVGWPGLEGNIDAAFTYKNGKTYFFKDSRYWRYVGRNMDGNYPKKISSGFPGIPSNLDAALVWGGNGKIYFSRGAQFWRFDPQKRQPVQPKYPLPISMWAGVPNDLSAALQVDGYTYFFKGDKYFRFNDRTFSIDRANPPFPRPIAYWWFGCRDTPKTLAHLEDQGDNENEFGEEYDDETQEEETLNQLEPRKGAAIATKFSFTLLIITFTLIFM